MLPPAVCVDEPGGYGHVGGGIVDIGAAEPRLGRSILPELGQMLEQSRRSAPAIRRIGVISALTEGDDDCFVHVFGAKVLRDERSDAGRSQRRRRPGCRGRRRGDRGGGRGGRWWERGGRRSCAGRSRGRRGERCCSRIGYHDVAPGKSLSEGEGCLASGARSGCGGFCERVRARGDGNRIIGVRCERGEGIHRQQRHGYPRCERNNTCESQTVNSPPLVTRHARLCTWSGKARQVTSKSSIFASR